MEKVVPFTKNQNGEHLWIDSLEGYRFIFILCPGRGPTNYIKTKMLITCFHVIQNVF